MKTASNNTSPGPSYRDNINDKNTETRNIPTTRKTNTTHKNKTSGQQITIKQKTRQKHNTTTIPHNRNPTRQTPTTPKIQHPHHTRHEYQHQNNTRQKQTTAPTRQQTPDLTTVTAVQSDDSHTPSQCHKLQQQPTTPTTGTTPTTKRFTAPLHGPTCFARCDTDVRWHHLTTTAPQHHNQYNQR